MTHYRRNALIALLFLILTSPVYATLVGETPANFQVSPSGAATYSLPIQVPPGINGMQPNLSLNYNSQAGNGLLGLGWNIGGLSAITRCPATPIQDGYKGGIKFNNKDRFCLDGQRLLFVGTSSDGGAEYRTAINNFSKIVSYGFAGSGPAYFRVWTKSGQIMEYATTNDSSIEAHERTDGAVLIWALSRIEDRNGNYLTISYVEDTINGESYPKDIYYTGNTSQGLLPNNHIELLYETRTDIVPRYVGGSKNITTKRLSKINTYANTYLTKGYRLTYTESELTGTSYLASIEECSADSSCLHPITFNWNKNATLTFSNSNTGPNTYVSEKSPILGLLSTNISLERVKFGDFNGDGRTDIYHISDGSSAGTLYLSNDGKYTQHKAGPIALDGSSTITGIRGRTNRIKLGDFDGDGLTDIYYVRGWGSTEKDYIYFSNGDGTFREKHNGPSTLISNANDDYTNNDINRIVIGDFNGDGRSDVYRINGGERIVKCGLLDPSCTFSVVYNEPDRVYLSNGNGTFTPTMYGPNTPIDYNSASSISTSLQRIRFGDFNGDGMTDVYRINGAGSSTADTVYLSKGNGTFQQLKSGPNTYIKNGGLEKTNFSLGSVKLGDFNGDGMTDVYYIRGWNSSLPDYVYLSKGDGTFTSANIGPSTYIDGASYEKANSTVSRIKFGDFNGDGLTDVYRIYGVNTMADSIYLSKGDGTFTSKLSGPKTPIGSKNLEYTNLDIKRIRFGDFNGDGMTDVYRIRGLGGGPTDTIYASEVSKPLISEIINSQSALIKVNYSPLTNANIYTKTTSSNYPVRDIHAPIYVVSKTAKDNGINNKSTTNYAYRGMKTHLTGRGNLGFSGMDILDITGDIKTSIEFMQDYPYIGMPSHTEMTVLGSGKQISETLSFYKYKSPFTGNLKGPVASYPNQSIDKTYDLSNGQLLTEKTTTSTYDTYGNPKTTSVTTSGNVETFSEVTTNYYTIDTTNYCLSMTNQSDVTITGADSSTITRTTTFGWDAATCRLTSSTVLPGEGDSLEMTTVYGYDGYGNRTSETVSGPVDTARSTKTDYTSNSAAYPDGQFATKVTNALNQFETREYDARFGAVTKLTGPNGIDTCFEYDELGRQVLERQYCGTAYETTTTTTYSWCDTTCPQYASYMVTTQRTGNAPITVYYDKLNRELRTLRIGFSDTPIFVDTIYDSKGHVAAVSEPYFEGDHSYWSIYTYDVLGRVETLQPPHNTTHPVTTIYNGFTTIVTDVLGRQRSKTKDAIGKTRSVTDALGNAITYQYDAAGNLTTTTDSTGNVITLTYDKRNRKIAMSDPDMGNWSYTYNTFGELLTQTDAKTQTTTMQYDALGRLRSRNAAEGSNTWTYDDPATPKSIGKLTRMNGAGDNVREFTYDDVGRPNQITDHIDMQAFITSKTYDYAGRIDTITYPANFAVKRIYNFNGYLTQVQSTDGATIYWQADSMNARGQILDNTLGLDPVSGNWAAHTSRSYNNATGWMDGTYSFNGAMATIQLNSYSFNAVGNLESRSDQRQGLTESFTYDDLDRVLTADIAGGSGTYVPRNYSYDALGNITSKSDVGSYTYGQNGAGPHAVTQAGTNTYAYDANGNMISGGGRTIGYTSFNKPNVITEGGTTVTFTYGADKSRIVKAVGSKRTVYVGLGAEGNALYERETEGSSVKHRHYIYAGGGQAVAIHTDDGTTDSMEYLHRDHLGSVEAITDVNGQVIERMSFDVWGKQRSVDWSDIPLGNYIVNTTNLGFTGHETIPEVGYIHMNGRVYDPVIGRFLSADPNIQTKIDTQSYNRYSYVSNNPLRYTDPTGYFLQGLFDAIGKFATEVWRAVSDFAIPIAAIYLSTYTGGLAQAWLTSAGTGPLVSSMVIGAISGATMGASAAALSGANLGDVLKAAQSGAASGAIGGASNVIFGPTLTGKIMGAAATAMATGGDADSVAIAAATAAAMHYLRNAGANKTPISAKADGKNVVIEYSDGTREVRSGGTRAWRNNNPGNIRNTSFANRHGSLGEAGGFAVFPDEATGQQAIIDLLETNTYQSLSIDDAITRYAPPLENNTGNYQALISDSTGINGNTMLNTLNAEQLNGVANAIRQVEGWQPGSIAY